MSPVSAEHYTRLGLPWFELNPAADIAAAENLAGLKSVAGLDADKGVPPASDEAPVGAE